MENLKTNYSVYRCPDPLKFRVGEPWYRIEDQCPCDPNAINITGRGYTPCAYGTQFEDLPMNRAVNYTGIPSEPLVGSLYNTKQIVPPQLYPRQNTRIGQQWRNSG